MSDFYTIWTLFKKESWRFLKVYNQTLFAPIVNILLLLAIFSLAVGGKYSFDGNISFTYFMSCGLIMMAAMQNAFANSSSSFVMGKVLGHIIDYLIPPISYKEILIAMMLGAVLRGLLVGILAFFAISFFVDVKIRFPLLAIFYLVGATCFLALLGVLCGIFSESFDQMSAITSYLITPLTFLSGTFYSINNLPEFWYHISKFNPFFYMIDGFRFAMSGYADGRIEIGIVYIVVANVVLYLVLLRMLKTGYRIKN